MKEYMDAQEEVSREIFDRLLAFWGAVEDGLRTRLEGFDPSVAESLIVATKIAWLQTGEIVRLMRDEREKGENLARKLKPGRWTIL